MAISIPAILDAQLLALQTYLRPHPTAATNTASQPHPPHVRINEVVDLIRLLTSLADSGTLTANGAHVDSDVTNVVSSADATDLATAQTLVNEIKADYNLHIATVAGGVHGAADTTNNVTSADATDLASAQTLANEIKGDYNAHRILTGGGEHANADATNVVAAANATDLATLITLVNEIKADYNAHRVQTSGTVHAQGPHGIADRANVSASADATDQATAITLANEIKADYNTHRALTTGGVHLAADTTNAVSSADATDLATLQTLVNEIKADYNAHRILTTSHRIADSTNAVTSPDATNLATAITLVNEIKADYNAHIDYQKSSTSSITDQTAFTGVNSLQGCTVTFNGNITAALANVTATVISNTTGTLFFNSGDLPAAPASGDTFTVAWDSLDTKLNYLNNNKNLGDGAGDIYGYGPTLIDVAILVITRMGASPSSNLIPSAAQPFSFGSPHAGGGTLGHGGGIVLADVLQQIRDAVAGYTAPA